MADEALTAQIGEALLDLVHQAKPAAVRVVRWVRDIAEPVPGVMLQSADGTCYTGIVVVHNNQPIMMMCAKTGSARTIVAPPPAPAYAPASRCGSSSSGYGSSSSSYGSRHLFEHEDEDPGEGFPPGPYRR